MTLLADHPDAPIHPLHQRCWACGENPFGLALRFRSNGDAVETVFNCDVRYAGYCGIIHGGIVASLLDCAMTNCLLNLGVPALTADLRVRYRRPVQCNTRAHVRAVVAERRGELWTLRPSFPRTPESKPTPPPGSCALPQPENGGSSCEAKVRSSSGLTSSMACCF